MTICATCWHKYGRSLAAGCCLCTGDVMTPTQFHAWSAANVPKIEARPEEAQISNVTSQGRIVFGQKPDKPKRRKASKKV